MLLISCGLAFALSFFTHKDEEEEEEAAPAKTEAPKAEAAPAKSADSIASAADANLPKDVITAVKAEEIKIDSPTPGEVVPYTEIPDPAFASGALGNGVGVKPSEDIVYAPMDGEIISVVDSKHAVGIQGDNGVELLIHVGVDTVKMEGDGFNCFVEQGAKIKKGDKLIAFDSGKIAAAGYSNMVVVLVTNSFDYTEVKVAGQ